MDASDGGEEELEEEHEYEWLVHLVNHFGRCHGFHQIYFVGAEGGGGWGGWGSGKGWGERR